MPIDEQVVVVVVGVVVGVLAALNLRLYYHAALIVAIMRYWIGRNRGCWKPEQE